MSYLPAEDAIRKCGSMGIAIPGGKFRIMEDGPTEIKEPDAVGELVYSGPNVTNGMRNVRQILKRETSAEAFCLPETWQSAMQRDITISPDGKNGF